MWFSLKLGFRGFFGISGKNRNSRQTIWITAARGHLKSQKSALKSLNVHEIPIFVYPNPHLESMHLKTHRYYRVRIVLMILASRHA